MRPGLAVSDGTRRKEINLKESMCLPMRRSGASNIDVHCDVEIWANVSSHPGRGSNGQNGARQTGEEPSAGQGGSGEGSRGRVRAYHPSLVAATGLVVVIIKRCGHLLDQ